MNSRVGRLGGHSHDARNLTFLFRSREATTHRVYLNEMDTQLLRFRKTRAGTSSIWAMYTAPWRPDWLETTLGSSRNTII